MGRHHREPIRHTCPEIDEIVKGIIEIQKVTKNYDRIEDIDDLQNIISQTENILWGFEDRLEELRRSNDTLRDWGVLEAEEVDRLENEVYELKNR